MAKSKTVAELAAIAELDLDEALVRLWEAGFPHLDEPTEKIPTSQLRAAQAALEIASKRDLTSPNYWRQHLGLDRPGFDALLQQLEIHLSPSARRLPKGAVSKLRRESNRRMQPPKAPPPPLPPQPSPLKWRLVGSSRGDLRYLDDSELIAIHDCLARDFADAEDPISPPGVRSENLLSSAASRPMTALGDELKYPTVEMSGAALLHSMVLNHPFHNGNKRTGLVALLVFLDENHMRLTCPEDELFRLVLLVAQHGLVKGASQDRSDREVLAIAEWICEHSRRSEAGERPLKWVRLNRILASYGCWADRSGSVGNRVNIYREVSSPRRGLFGKRAEKTRALHTQVACGDDGSEMGRSTISKIRRDLQLDDEHGIDSRTFYESAAAPALDFIVIYRKTLSRLARL